MYALRFLAFVELIIDPEDRDDAKSQVTRVGGANRVKACKLRQARQYLTQERIPCMPNMKRMQHIRLGIFDHDPLIFGRTPPKVRAGGEHFIHDSPGVLSGRKVEIKIAL